MSWRLAESLKQLRAQLNEDFPNRDKKSDGSIGDEKHSARKSDHNPNSAGVVTAIDITHDPNTVDGNRLAEVLFESGDPRIKYLIWNRRITKADKSGWKKYTGANAHAHHLHISVSSDPKLYDSKKEWNLDELSAATSLNQNQTSQPPINPGASDTGGLTGQPEAETNQTANQASAPETTETTTVEKTDSTTTQITSAKNEQDVNEPAEVAAPAPQGVAAKLKAGIGTLFGGTIVYTIAEKFGAMSFSTQAIILFAVVAVIALIGFMFWAWLDAWKQQNRLKLEVEAKTAIDRKDVLWK